MIVPIDSIVVPEDRQRKFFDIEHIEALRKSILSKGLLHAIVVEKDGHTLLAGECRLRAIRSIYGSGLEFQYNGELVPKGSIPAISIGDLSAIETREAQLEENIARRDLSWQERIQAISELHTFRVAQSQGKQTYTDTAKEILGPDNFYSSAPSDLVKDSVIVAKHLNDPDVRRANSAAAATKIVRRKLAMETARAALPATASPHELIVADCTIALRQLPAGTFDVILTDPPYGLDADSFGNQAQIVHTYEDDPERAMQLYLTLAHEGLRVTKDQAHAFVFVHINFFEAVKDLFKEASSEWEVFNTPLIWAKGTTTNSPGHIPWANRGPRRMYEAILYANKGKKNVNKLFPDVLLHEGVPMDQRLHAAEKPVSLLRQLLSISALPGDRVLDPFCGSGSVFLAATAERMVATGIELSESTAAIARGRM